MDCETEAEQTSRHLSKFCSRLFLFYFQIGPPGDPGPKGDKVWKLFLCSFLGFNGYLYCYITEKGIKVKQYAWGSRNSNRLRLWINKKTGISLNDKEVVFSFEMIIRSEPLYIRS